MSILTCMFLFKNAKTQNLINNGSFEFFTNIDCNSGLFDNVSSFPVTHVVDNWQTVYTPDYYNSVCTPGGYSVPNAYLGYNNSKQGSAYAGLGLYEQGNEIKEYIYQQLSSPLIAGRTYCMSFFIVRAERTEYAIIPIGAYLSVSTPTLVNNQYINATPQIVNQAIFLTDTTNWTEIQGCFTADGGEQYVTIGNFNSNNNTDTLNLGTNNPMPSWPKTAYYYIDDITLIDQTTVGINESDPLSLDNIIVYPNPGTGMFEFSFATKGKYTIHISNSLGQLIRIINLENNTSQIDLRDEQEGVYFYYVSTNSKKIKTGKIILIK